MDVFPPNHPSLLNVNPDELSQDVKAIIMNLKADFLARKITLQALLKQIKSFKYDYHQLKAGFAPTVPEHPFTDPVMGKYAENNLSLVEEMLSLLIQEYLELHALTLEVLTGTPEQWLKEVQILPDPATDSETSQ
jgi:hypothetical protein